MAAELAAARPRVPLAGLAGELADQQQRLDLLDAGGDPRTAVRAVFSWSYRHLDPDAARAFRLAGLHPGTDFDRLRGRRAHRHHRRSRPPAAGACWPARTWSSRPGPGRYGMHDLLRAYAASWPHATTPNRSGTRR